MIGTGGERELRDSMLSASFDDDDDDDDSHQDSIIISILASFSHQCQQVVSHWSLSNSKSHHISRTLLSILADLNTALVCMVSILIWFLIPPVSFPSFWRLFQVGQQLLISPSTSCSTIFSTLLKQDPSISLPFRCLKFTLSVKQEQQNTPMASSFVFSFILFFFNLFFIFIFIYLFIFFFFFWHVVWSFGRD